MWLLYEVFVSFHSIKRQTHLHNNKERNFEKKIHNAISSAGSCESFVAKSGGLFEIVCIYVCVCVCVECVTLLRRRQRVQVVRAVGGGIGFWCCLVHAVVELKFRCILLGVLATGSTLARSCSCGWNVQWVMNDCNMSVKMLLQQLAIVGVE